MFANPKKESVTSNLNKMNRRNFLQRAGISAGVLAVAPMLVAKEIAAESIAAESIPIVGSEWQHFEAIRLIKGRKYLIYFDYITANNKPIQVDICEYPGTSHEGFPAFQFHPEENAKEITHLVIKESEFTLDSLSVKEIPAQMPKMKTLPKPHYALPKNEWKSKPLNWSYTYPQRRIQHR